MHFSGAGAPPPAVAPSLVSSSSGATSSLVSSPTITKPSGLVEGNVLVLAFRNQAATHSGGDSFIKVGEVTTGSNGDHLSIWRKTVTSSEDASFNFSMSGSTRCAWVMLQFEDARAGADGIDVEFHESLDPPSLSFPWGSGLARVVTVASHGRTDNTLTAPSGYAEQVDGASASSDASTRTRVASATRQVDAGSENPGAWGTSGGTPVAPITATIGLRPE